MLAQFDAADLTSTVAVTVSARSGARTSVTGTSPGNNGANGTLSSFGPYLNAQGGQHGSGGGAGVQPRAGTRRLASRPAPQAARRHRWAPPGGLTSGGLERKDLAA